MTARILTPASPNWDELPLETDPLTYKDVIERLTKLVDRAFARARDEVGQALLEFAIVTPIFLLLMFGALDVELALADLGSVRFIAQQAAICETRAAQGCNVSGYVMAAAPGLGLVPAQLTVTIEGATSVQVTYQYQGFSRWFRGITLAATASTP